MTRIVRAVGVAFATLTLSIIGVGVGSASAAPLGCPATATLSVSKTTPSTTVPLGSEVDFTIVIKSNTCITTGTYKDVPDTGLVVATADVPLLNGGFVLDGADAYTKTITIHTNADKTGTLVNSVSASGVAIGRTFTGAFLNRKGQCVSDIPTPTPTTDALKPQQVIIEDVPCKNVSGEASASVDVAAPQGSPGPQGPPGPAGSPAPTSPPSNNNSNMSSVPSLPSTGEE